MIKRKPKPVAKISTTPMDEWEFAGHVEYEIAPDGLTAVLFYQYKVSHWDALRLKTAAARKGVPESEMLPPGEYTIRLGRCHKNVDLDLWTGKSKWGHLVHFTTPTAIGYGMVTGELKCR